MKFSVIIPLYNKEHYIKSTIQSVLNQTFQDYELIVVDDGSKDNSYSVAQTIKSEKIRIIRQENQGVAVARNTGILNAQGEYIAFLDADDNWYPNYLETINELTKQFSIPDIYVTAYRIVMGQDKFHFSAHLCDENTILSSYWVTFKNAYDIVWTSATVIKRDAIIKAGMFTPGEKIGQDLDLWARVACNNAQVAYSPKICVDYNRNAEQNARSRVKIAFPECFLKVLDREIQSGQWTEEDKKCMASKFNKKMMVYCYTTLLSGKRMEARNILRSWTKQRPNKYIAFLWVASFMPMPILKYIYDIRLKVF